MPKIDITVDSHKLTIVYEEGKEGFVEIRNTGDTSLHIRDEDGSLLGLHFVENEVEPVTQFDFVSGEAKYRTNLKKGASYARIGCEQISRKPLRA